MPLKGNATIVTLLGVASYVCDVYILLKALRLYDLPVLLTYTPWYCPLTQIVKNEITYFIFRDYKVSDANFKNHVNMVTKLSLGVALGRAGFTVEKEFDIQSRKKMPSLLLLIKPI